MYNSVSNNQKKMVKKKNSTIMSDSLAKKRMRNNSALSFKSNSSLVSENGFLGKVENPNAKSAFANELDFNENKECPSQIMKELICSLVHVFEI